MAKRKKKNPAADKLIDSLIEDLNPAKSEVTSYGKTSTSIARSSDLIRDLEKDIALAEQRAAAEAAGVVVESSEPEASIPTDIPEDFSAELDAAEFSVPAAEEAEIEIEETSYSPYPEELLAAQDSPFLAPASVYDAESDIFSQSSESSEPEEQSVVASETVMPPDALLPDSVIASSYEYENVPSVSSIFSSQAVSSSEDDATKPVIEGLSDNEDQTVSIQSPESHSVVSMVTGMTGTTDKEKTLAVEGFAQNRGATKKKPEVDVKVSIGGFRGGRTGGNVMTSVDASLAQAENLRLAQQRILGLEKEVESLRAENEELASAADIIRTRSEEMVAQLTRQEHEKSDIQESFQSELLVLKGNLQHKDTELGKARQKVDELETRLKSDFKKIRVRERELENRLELLRAEKTALVRSKDEYILDLKRKIDQAGTELDNYRKKVAELNRTIDTNQEQVKRTERALRLALNNLEAQEENLVPLKKAD